MQNAECRMQNEGSPSVNAECKMQNAECRMEGRFAPNISDLTGIKKQPCSRRIDVLHFNYTFKYSFIINTLSS